MIGGVIVIIAGGLILAGTVIAPILDWAYPPVRYLRCGCVDFMQCQRWTGKNLDIDECEHCGATWDHEEGT